MRHLIPSALAALAVLAPAASRADIPVVHDDEAQLDVGLRTQMMGFAQRLEDGVKDDNRVFLFLKQARLRGNGRYHDTRFHMEMALGGEESVVATTGVSLSLLDLNVDVPLGVLGKSFLKVGQFKVPYGRERLTYSGDMQFIDRSVQDLGFRVGRDVGAAVTLMPGDFQVTAGVFTGGGRDAPLRFLPEKLGVPELVVRAAWGDADADPYALGNDLKPAKLKKAVAVNALYTKDSAVGHSSVLNVKLADKSMLLNGNWNPYIAKQPLSQGTFWQVGADAAVRAPLGNAQLNAELEANWAGYENAAGVAHVAGGRAQAVVGFGNFEVGARYAVLFPDAAFKVGATSLTGHDPIHEITPSAAWYLKGTHLKLVADLPVMLQTPVVTEKNVGSYVTTEMPDQTSILAKEGNTIARQNVVEARVMVQAAF